MKQTAVKLIVLCLLSVIMVTLCPRFGWRLGREIVSMDNVYYYQGRVQEDDSTLVTYTNKSEQSISIAYSDRLSRHLTIYTFDGETYEMNVRMDRAIINSPAAPDSLTWVLYSILASDASGSLFWVYIKPLACLLAAYAILYHLKKADMRCGVVINVILAALAVLSIIFSFRIL